MIGKSDSLILGGIGSAIRSKTGKSAKLAPSDMAGEVGSIVIWPSPTLLVTAPDGSDVTISMGGTVITGKGTGAPVEYELPLLGTWTVKATQGSDEASETVVVSEVKEYVVALSFGTPIGTLAVGSIVKMRVNGAVWEWLIPQQGNPDPGLYDTSCDGTWCLLKDCYERRQWNSSNYNDYENSTIDAYLNGDWFNLLDAGIRSQVKQVRIPYRPGAGDNKTPINGGGNGLLTRAFLLSAPEVGFTTANTSNYAPMDGARLAYFPDGSGADPKRAAKLNGSATRWWLRSPVCYHGEGADYAMRVYSGGNWDYGGCSGSYGIRPCIILPRTATIDDNNNVNPK